MQRATSLNVFQCFPDHVFLLKSVIVSDDLTGPGFTWSLGVSNASRSSYVYIHTVTEAIHIDEVELWTVINSNDWVTLYVDPAPVRYWIAGAILPAPPYELPN